MRFMIPLTLVTLTIAFNSLAAEDYNYIRSNREKGQLHQIVDGSTDTADILTNVQKVDYTSRRLLNDVEKIESQAKAVKESILISTFINVLETNLAKNRCHNMSGKDFTGCFNDSVLSTDKTLRNKGVLGRLLINR